MMTMMIASLCLVVCVFGRNVEGVATPCHCDREYRESYCGEDATYIDAISLKEACRNTSLQLVYRSVSCLRHIKQWFPKLKGITINPASNESLECFCPQDVAVINAECPVTPKPDPLPTTTHTPSAKTGIIVGVSAGVAAVGCLVLVVGGYALWVKRRRAAGGGQEYTSFSQAEE